MTMQVRIYSIEASFKPGDRAGMLGYSEFANTAGECRSPSNANTVPSILAVDCFGRTSVGRVKPPRPAENLASRSDAIHPVLRSEESEAVPYR
jgi:hypothetical protein